MSFSYLGEMPLGKGVKMVKNDSFLLKR